MPACTGDINATLSVLLRARVAAGQCTERQLEVASPHHVCHHHRAHQRFSVQATAVSHLAQLLSTARQVAAVLKTFARR